MGCGQAARASSCSSFVFLIKRLLYQEKYTIEEIASISRELSYNDPFIVDAFNDAVFRTGTPKDRNVELLIFNPLKRCK